MPDTNKHLQGDSDAPAAGSRRRPEPRSSRQRSWRVQLNHCIRWTDQIKPPLSSRRAEVGAAGHPTWSGRPQSASSSLLSIEWSTSDTKMAAVASLRCSLSAVVARRPQVGPRRPPEGPPASARGSWSDALPSPPTAGPARGRRSPPARRPPAQRRRARRLRRGQEGEPAPGRNAPATVARRQTLCTRLPPLPRAAHTSPPPLLPPTPTGRVRQHGLPHLLQAGQGRRRGVPLARHPAVRGCASAAGDPSNLLPAAADWKASCSVLSRLPESAVLAHAHSLAPGAPSAWIRQVTASSTLCARSPKSLRPRWRLPP